MSWKSCPFCVQGSCLFGKANMQRRENNKGHRGYRHPGVCLTHEEWIMAMSRGTGPGKPCSPAMYEVSDWSMHYPKLWEHLVEELFEDGTRRVVSTLLLMGEDGWMKACLNDRAEDRVAWVAGKSMEDCLDALESKLNNGNMEWRRQLPKQRSR